jgi:tRNA-specific 2-thiouridylase
MAPREATADRHGRMACRGGTGCYIGDMSVRTLPEIPAAVPPGSRIVVAMSGGVDSSATAALLVEHGFEVIGITLQLYDHGVAIGRPGSCCAGQDIHDARRVADRLAIPHYVLDYEARFRAAVIDDFAAAYAAGETPIPCVRCNQRVKFADLLQTAADLGAAALATGHYVRRIDDTADGPALYRGSDAARDQSYFLFATTRAQLAMLIFPLGASGKDEVRRLAARHRLPVAAKADSQDICFVPAGGYARVLERLRPDALMPGDIVDEKGRVLGRHAGVARFTIGQRRGLRVASAEPLYVLRLEPAEARVVVGPLAALARQRFRLREVNWLGAPVPSRPLSVSVKVRSTMAPVAAALELAAEGEADVTLAEPHPGIAPGQACVFYDGERLLGGGFIDRDQPEPARTRC